MEINEFNIDSILNKYTIFVNNVSSHFRYDNNIKHVLYIIVPAFIIKYGIINERKILNTFENVKIVINDTEDSQNIASFNRKIIKLNNKYELEKKIILNRYKKESLVNLIDSLVHEFNHAMNSINNEMTIEQDYIYLRSGITCIKYDKETLKKVPLKFNGLILEEVLNTIQTEQIINVILSWAKYHEKIKNNELNNMLYVLNREITTKYTSKAYMLETFISKELVKNKTFIYTLEKLRFTGDISDIENWFDNITGTINSYKKLCNKLDQLQELEKQYIYSKWFKKRIIYKMRLILNQITDIIEIFNKNCIYK